VLCVVFQVIINLQKTPYDKKATLRIFAKTDEVFELLMKELEVPILAPPKWRPAHPKPDAPEWSRGFIYGWGDVADLKAKAQAHAQPQTADAKSSPQTPASASTASAAAAPKVMPKPASALQAAAAAASAVSAAPAAASTASAADSKVQAPPSKAAADAKDSKASAATTKQPELPASLFVGNTYEIVQDPRDKVKSDKYVERRWVWCGVCVASYLLCGTVQMDCVCVCHLYQSESLSLQRLF
jgi:hypothetical protein